MSLSNRTTSNENAEMSTVEEKIVKVNGEIAYRRYQKGRFLGKGGFARVYELTCLDNKKSSAAKLIPKSSLSKARARQKLMSEIKIHRSLHHSGIVLFEHFFEDQENVYILLELCQNQTLSEMMRRRKRLTELEAQCYLFQVIAALRYLHAHRVIHRDIKLGNLFLTDKMEIKLGDFGLAAKLEFEGEKKRTICGTPNYIAPEILDGKTGHSYEVDIWSVGVLLFTLVVGKPPFETSDVKTTYRRIKMNAYTFPPHVQLSDNVKSLISRILLTDPSSRPSLDEVLAHPFFTSTPFPKLMPGSTLAVPPSSAFVKQFQKNEEAPPRSADTTPREKETTNSGRANVRKASVSSFNPPVHFEGAGLWVKKWVDYSSKYGLGYLLSNNCIGVFFNDSTKMISKADGSYFQYIHKTGPNREDQGKEYPTAQYPPELHKKVMLLQHFRKHLVPDGICRGNGEYVYVKKWVTTSHAIIFRLSNKIVQVSFQDKTEIILCSNSKVVTYVNKLGEPSVYPLRVASESGNMEMTKRLKYTKEVLTNMLGGPNGGGISNR